jgi:hypothetical protein
MTSEAVIVIPRSRSTVLEGDRATTTTAELELLHHADLLSLIRIRFANLGDELFRCCTEEDFMSSGRTTLVLIVSFCEMRLTIVAFYDLIHTMQGEMRFSSAY